MIPTKCLIFVIVIYVSESSRYADQLYEDLLYFYNRSVRPVRNTTEPLRVKFGASLIRIIDVDEVNQVLTTSLWLEMQWYDYKLLWDPEKFGGIKKVHIPSDQIWIPDILLYNNADGEPHISVTSDAIVYYTGLVVWKPPSIYKSFCPIDIEYFPYDQQHCEMKFGGWSYHGFLMDVIQLTEHPEDIRNQLDRKGKHSQFLEQGMDLSSYYPSNEWDLLEVSSARHEELYPGCCGPDYYIDITFHITIRRKTLFYTVNLVLPCAMIAFLTIFVFYIPAIEHKITHSISVLVTLTVFYLVLIELIPPTSLVIPLIGQYILFTMFLVSFSIILSVVTVNWYRRDGTLHTMPPWLYVVFVRYLPWMLRMEKPEEDEVHSEEGSLSEVSISDLFNAESPDSPFFENVTQMAETELRLSQLAQLRGMHPDTIRRMIDNVNFIANYYKDKQKRDKISDLWSFVAMVMDNLMLYIFTFVFVLGTLLIIARSPYLAESISPLGVQLATKPLSADTIEFALKDSNFTYSNFNFQ
ncbi:unnamed protein product [Bursaphelenchus xylophilus]|uniref:(pine wood nematode) hypothetical protein n=1 Tax=Bursaphelenchus xylophilus TaxID=6326 RepID=A0A1I7RR83_BURXY|nr:unnamed protein product [Bursaphelenchus xylophilus]CAG9130870.1 unnamed protein product [Bursaphelenchus xylophilus]